MFSVQFFVGRYEFVELEFPLIANRNLIEKVKEDITGMALGTIIYIKTSP